MAQVITIAGERLFALKAQNNEQLDIDTFIFANVPGQDPNATIDRNESVPPVGQQVHQQIVQQVGRVNDNVVIYSTVLDSVTGPFDFNWVGLYSSVNQTLIAVSHIPSVSKTITVPGAAGNTLNRNFGIEYSGIADLTGITVAPETWQLDFTARLSGMDELTRQLAADMNGKDWFIGDGFKVEPRSTTNTFKVTPGAGYVSGLRVELKQDHILTMQSYPQFVYVDAWFDGDASSKWAPKTAFTVTNGEMDDYIDVNGKQHYVFKLARITAADTVVDLRNTNGIREDVNNHISNEIEHHNSIYNRQFNSLEDAVLTVFPLSSSGTSIELKERNSGKGGGAVWDIVLTSSVNPDAKGIVQSIGNPLLSFRQRVDASFTFENVSAMVAAGPFSFGSTIDVKNTGGISDRYSITSSATGVLITSGQYATKLEVKEKLGTPRVENFMRKNNASHEPLIGGLFYIVGDSITEGTKTNMFDIEPWAAMVRNVFNKKYNTNNIGFINVREHGAGITNFHKQTRVGFAFPVFNAGLFGGTLSSSTAIGDTISWTYYGRSAQVVYDKLPGNGTFEVRLDGTLVDTINCDGPEDRGVFSTRYNTTNFGFKVHTLEVKNITAALVNIMGVIYSDGYDDSEPRVMNVGRSSLRGGDLTNNMIDKYSTSGALIVALGVNDSLGSTSVSAYETNMRRLAQNNKDVNGQMLFLDFIFNESVSTNIYKQALRRVAADFSNASIIDFADEWFANEAINESFDLVADDGVHPTPHGHRLIADAVFKWLGYGTTEGLPEYNNNLALISGSTRHNYSPNHATYLLDSGNPIPANTRAGLLLKDVVSTDIKEQAKWLNSKSVRVTAEILIGGVWYDSGWYNDNGVAYGAKASLTGNISPVSTSGGIGDTIVYRTANDGVAHMFPALSGGTYPSQAANLASAPIRLVLTKSD